MYQNPEALYFQTVYTTILTPQDSIAPSEKVYLIDNPMVKANKMVALVSYLGGVNIAANTPIPQNGEIVTVGAAPFYDLANYLYLTLCNSKNEIVFYNIPYVGLVNVDPTRNYGRVKRYTGVNIDLSKSYFQLAPGVSISTRTIIVPLTFYLNKK
jgi:hypothetical protein